MRPETRSPSIQEVAEARGIPKLWTGHRGRSGATSTACQGHGSPHPQEGQPRLTEAFPAAPLPTHGLRAELEWGGCSVKSHVVTSRILTPPLRPQVLCADSPASSQRPGCTSIPRGRARAGARSWPRNSPIDLGRGAVEGVILLRAAPAVWRDRAGPAEPPERRFPRLPWAQEAQWVTTHPTQGQLPESQTG